MTESASESYDERRGGWGRLVLLWAGGVPGALLLYVASVGPVVGAMLVYTSITPSGWQMTAIEIIYAPLIWLSEASPEVQRFFRWYIETCAEAMS